MPRGVPKKRGREEEDEVVAEEVADVPSDAPMKRKTPAVKKPKTPAPKKPRAEAAPEPEAAPST